MKQSCKFYGPAARAHDEEGAAAAMRLGRRSLLGLGGLLSTAAGARAAAPAKAGERLRIDCQSHTFAPAVLAKLEQRTSSPFAFRRGEDAFVVVGPWQRRVLPGHVDMAMKVAAMDAAGIQMTALSINDPGPELFGQDGPEIARLAHDHIASVAAAYPGRFFGLATLPLQDMDAAIVELERCVSKLGFRGILLYSNLGGRFPDDPAFRPLWKRAADMGVPILLHPAYPVTYEQTQGYNMVSGLGLMFDTTIALTRIILSGLLEQHPTVKLVCPHVGGTLPYLIGRVDHQVTVLRRGGEHLRRPPSSYLREVYLDVVSPLPEAIRYAHTFAGPDRLLYASDHPWVDPSLIVANVKALRLPAADEARLFRDNARKLFSL
jgi:predicted TIM-barrel fold metal-dependent hydrolase